jgi:cation-transporting P-type ATPase C
LKEISVLPGRVRFQTNKAYRNKKISEYIDIYTENLYGVKYSNVNHNTGTILVAYDETKTNLKSIKNNIEQALCSEINFNSNAFEFYNQYYHTKKRKTRIKAKFIGSSLIYLLFKVKQSLFGKFFISSSIGMLGAASAVTIIGGYPLLKNFYKRFTKHIHHDSELLLKLAAVSFSILRESTEGLFLIVLIDFTNYIKLSADLKCQRLLKNSMVKPPNTAWIITNNGDEMLIPVKSLNIGDTVCIHRGEVVPIEGEVFEGKAIVNSLYYTGQPFISSIAEGHKVYEGVIVLSGELKIRVLKIPEMLNKNDLPFEKLALNEKVVKFQDRIIPIAVGLAAMTYLFTGNMLNALSVILVLCPASSELALSTGIKNYFYLLNKYNIYLRNPNTVEKIVNTNSIIFDKTGTLTQGNMKIVYIKSFDENYTNKDLLKICAASETDNHNPISITIQSELQKLYSMNKVQVTDDSEKSNEDYEKVYDLNIVQKSVLIPSKGIKAVYNNHSVLIGNDEFFKENNISLDIIIDEYLYYQKNLYTPILISIDNSLTGIIVMQENIRDDAYDLVNKLKSNGITNISLLTGDSQDKAKYVSDKLGITTTYGDCNYKEKLRIIEQQKLQNTVMMVGDGINDVLAMRAADISVSFANSSCDKIKLNSDCIVFEENIDRLSDLIMLSKTVYKKIDQNIKIANLYNVIFGTLAVLGGFDVFAAKSIDTINSIFVLILNERIKLTIPNKKKINYKNIQ